MVTRKQISWDRFSERIEDHEEEINFGDRVYHAHYGWGLFTFHDEDHETGQRNGFSWVDYDEDSIQVETKLLRKYEYVMLPRNEEGAAEMLEEVYSLLIVAAETGVGTDPDLFPKDIVKRFNLAAEYINQVRSKKSVNSQR